MLREGPCHNERYPAEHAEKRSEVRSRRPGGGSPPSVFGPIFDLITAVEDAPAMFSEWRARTLPADAIERVSLELQHFGRFSGGER